MAVQIQFRNDTSTNWSSTNPILALAEMGIETDTNKFKIGNGLDVWNTLPYGGIQGADGNTGGNPKMLSGQYYFPPVSSNAAAGQTLGYCYWIPFFVPNDITASHLAVIASSGIASSTVRLGIYNSDENTLLPTTLLLDAGTVSCATIGVKAVTISQSLTAGLYFLSAVSQTVAPQLRNHQNSLFPIRNTITSPYPQGNINCFVATGINGDLPATVPSIQAFAGAPIVMVGVA